MVPSAVSAFADIGAGTKDGISSLHCMSTKDYIKVYNDDKYWNLDVKEDLLSQTRSLWQEIDADYKARKFVMQNSPTEDELLTHAKVEQEMQAAIAKHGEVEDFVTVEEQYKEQLRQTREKAASA